MKKALQIIEALSTPQPSADGNFDASQIMIQFNMILVQLKQKADNNKYEELRDELGKFKVEYYKFREQDFMALGSRVTDLEKRLEKLSHKVSEIKMPEHVSTGKFDSSAIE